MIGHMASPEDFSYPTSQRIAEQLAASSIQFFDLDEEILQREMDDILVEWRQDGTL